MSAYTAFLLALELNSFSEAARAMGYTQSAVSQMIKGLEEDLGVTLLVRSRTGVSLTREGAALLPHIRDVANAHRVLSEQAAAVRGLEQGSVRIGTFTSVSSSLLPPAIKRFREQHPGIRFELHQGLYHEVEAWVRDGVVDFSFTDLIRPTDFAFEPLIQDSLLLVCAKDHSLAQQTQVSVEQLASEPFILLEEGRGGATLKRFLDAHPELDVQYRVADDYSILNMVENRLGVAVLPEMVLRNTASRVAALPLEPPLRRSLGIIFRRKAALSTAAQAFLRELRAGIAEQQDKPTLYIEKELC